MEINSIRNASDQEIDEVSANLTMRFPTSEEFIRHFDDVSRQSLNHLRSIQAPPMQRVQPADWLDENCDATMSEIHIANSDKTVDQLYDTRWMNDLGLARYQMPSELGAWLHEVKLGAGIGSDGEVKGNLKAQLEYFDASEEDLKHQIREVRDTLEVSKTHERSGDVVLLATLYSRFDKLRAASLDTFYVEDNSFSTCRTVEQGLGKMEAMLLDWENEMPLAIERRKEQTVDLEVSLRHKIALERAAEIESQNGGRKTKGLEAAARDGAGMLLTWEQQKQILMTFYLQGGQGKENRSASLQFSPRGERGVIPSFGSSGGNTQRSRVDIMRRILLRFRLIKVIKRERNIEIALQNVKENAREERAKLRTHIGRLQSQVESMRFALESTRESGRDFSDTSERDRLIVESLTAARAAQLEAAINDLRGINEELRASNAKLQLQERNNRAQFEALKEQVVCIQKVWKEKEATYKKMDDDLAAAWRGKRTDDKQWRTYTQEIFNLFVSGFSRMVPQVVAAFQQHPSCPHVRSCAMGLSELLDECKNNISSDSICVILTEMKAVLSSLVSQGPIDEQTTTRVGVTDKDFVERLAVKLDNAMTELRVRYREDRYMRRTIEYFCKECFSIIHKTKHFAMTENALDFPPSEIVKDDVDYGYSFLEERKMLHGVLQTLQATIMTGIDKSEGVNALLRALEISTASSEKETDQSKKEDSHKEDTEKTASTKQLQLAKGQGPFSGGRYVVSPEELKKEYGADKLVISHLRRGPETPPHAPVNGKKNLLVGLNS